MTRTSLCAAATVAVSFTFASAPSFAQEKGADAEPDKEWIRSQSSRVGLEFDFWPSHSGQEFLGNEFDITILSFGIAAVGQYEIADKFFLTAQIPFAAVHYSVSVTQRDPVTGETEEESDSDSAATFGNPTVGAYYADMLPVPDPQMAFFAGGSLSAPVIFDPDEYQSVAVAAGLSTRAGLDAHRFAPESLPVRAHGGVEIKIIPNLYYRGDLAPTFYVPLDSQDAEFFIDQGNELEYRADSGLGAGFRLQEVFTLTDGDKIQTATELFGVYEPPGSGAYLRLGFLLALDKTMGFGFDEGKVASVRAAGGYEF